MIINNRLSTINARPLLMILLILCIVSCAPMDDLTSVPSETSEGNIADIITSTLAILSPTKTASIPTSAPTPTAAPTTTPTETAHFPICGPDDPINAKFIQDLSITDGTQLLPNTAFTKSWELENNGGCVWPPGTMVTQVAGHVLPGGQAAPIPATRPGERAAVTVTLTTPTQSGHYTGYWRLRAPETGLFGAVIFFDITVSPDAPPPPPVPTSTGTPLPQPTATPDIAPQPATTCYTPDPSFFDIINQATPLGIHLRCPAGPARTVTGEVQAFWLDGEINATEPTTPSLLILREDIHKIYVLVAREGSTHAVQVISDDASQAMGAGETASASPQLIPPEGLDIPTGRLGRVWLRHSLWVTIGWSREVAAPVSLKIQETENGVLIQIDEGKSMAHIAIDFNTMRAIVR